MGRPLLAAGLAAIVLALAACGGEDSGSASQWADSVCSSLGDWRTDVEATVEELSANPSALSADSLRAAADDTLESTETLVDELRELGAPDTESGEQVRAELEELTESLERRRDRVRETIEASSESIAGVLASLSSITAELQAAANDVAAAVGRLEALDPGGELEQAFRDEDSCVALQR